MAWVQTNAVQRTAVTNVAAGVYFEQPANTTLVITLEPDEYAAVTCIATFPATASDAEFLIRPSGNGTTFDTYGNPIVLPAVASTTQQKTVNIEGVKYFAVTVRSTGANNLTSADLIVQKATR